MTKTQSNLTGKLSPAEAVLALAEAEGIPEPAAAPADQPGTTNYPHEGGRFEVSGAGVYWCKGDGAKRRVCDELRAVAKTRDRNGGNWGLVLAWHDGDGNLHRETMPCETLHGESADAVRMLASGGLRIEPNQNAKVLAYLKVCEPEKRVRCVEQLGWHSGAYCAPAGTIGALPGEDVEFRSASTASTDASRSGAAEEWRQQVAALAVGNSRLVLAICCGFAGPLLHIAGVESGGFHIVGPSSCGKTTALHLAASVWGNPERYTRTWRATANGLESVAAVHNDGLLILDELSQCEPKQAGEAAYMLANGKGKARASRTGGARPAATWRLIVLSSGEVPLSVQLESVGKRANAGQEVRLANIPADAGAGWGIFENLHGHEPSGFANALKDAAARFHGHAGREFVRFLVDTDRQALEETIAEGVADFVKEVAPNASGQVLRVAQRFGLIAVAGELAIAYRLTGWEEGEAHRACAACFAAWHEGFGVGNHEDKSLIERVIGFVERHGASRFQKLDAEEAITRDRAGFWREVDSTRQYLFTTDVFRSELAAGFDPKRAPKVLHAHGLLVAGPDRLATKVRLPGFGPRWVYVIVIPEEAA